MRLLVSPCKLVLSFRAVLQALRRSKATALTELLPGCEITAGSPFDSSYEYCILDDLF